MKLTDLLETFAALPAPLPADALTGLLTLAAAEPPRSRVRSQLIARPDLTRDQARQLVGAHSEHLGTYLARPDTPADEVIALLTAHPDHEAGFTIAGETRDVAVLEHLATHRSARITIRVAGNRAAPAPVAARAVGSALADLEQSRARCATPAGDVTLGPDNGSRLTSLGSGYDWLKYAHSVPDAAVNAWAPTTRNLGALVTVLRHRQGLDPAVASRAVDLVLDLVPDGTTNLSGTHAIAALRELTDCGALRDGPPRRRLLEQLEVRNLRVGRVPVARELGLEVAPKRTKPVAERSWRNVATEAAKTPETAAALLTALADIVGDDPATWQTMAQLSGRHTGTVDVLGHAAAAIACPVPTD